MNIIIFLLANLIVIWTAINFTRQLKIADVVTQLISIFTITLAQIIVSLIICGTVFKFTSIPVIIFNIILFSLSILLNIKLQPDKLQFNLILKNSKELFFSPWTIVLLFLVFCAGLWNLVFVYLVPTYTYDSMTYHLVSVVTWLQQENIVLTPYEIWTNVYPQNTELIFAWIVLFLKNDTLVDIGQFIFSMGGFLAVVGIARVFNISRSYSVAAACLFYLTPTILVQINTNYTDVAMASMFLVFFYLCLKFVNEKKLNYLLLAGIAGGISLGIKSSAVAFIGLTAIMVVLSLITSIRKKEHNKSWAILSLITFSFPIVIIGSFWYIRTWWHYGNPIYPFIVSVMGHTIFEGTGSVHDLIMVSNTPKEIIDKSWLEQIWYSWSSRPKFYRYDEALGGFGVQWLYLLFPSVLIAFAHSVFKNRKILLTFIIPFTALFVIVPSNWWARYTIFFVSVGAISFVYVLNLLKNRIINNFLKLSSILLILVSLFFCFPNAFFHQSTMVDIAKLPKDQRTIGKIVWQEFEWVDKIKEGSIISMPRGEHAFVYPLFGSSLNNRVHMMENQESYEAFLSDIINSNSEYLFTKSDSKYDVWAKENIGVFQIFHSAFNYNVYKIIK